MRLDFLHGSLSAPTHREITLLDDHWLANVLAVSQLLREKNLLRIARGLRPMPHRQGPFLVINRKILGRVPFQQGLQYYRSHRALLTADSEHVRYFN